MLGYAIFAFEIIAVIAVLFVAPGWMFIWELVTGRTVPPFRVERAKQPGRYWLCIMAHVLGWIFWIVLWVLLILFLIMMQPDFYN